MTFACVDKSVFHSKYVDRITTTTTTTTSTTTTTTTTPITKSDTDNILNATPKPVITNNGELLSRESKVNLKSEIVNNNIRDKDSNVPAILESNSNFEEVK